MTTSHTVLVPSGPVPDFEVSCTDGTTFKLSGSSPKSFTLIEIYRGRHCPRCHRHLLSLKGVLPRLAERGVEVVAISMDDARRARDAVATWGLDPLPVGYGLSQHQARSLGLYMSEAIGENEPRLFAEPASLWVRPDQTLYAAAYQTTPFARPHWTDWLEALDVIAARNYPARGTHR